MKLQIKAGILQSAIHHDTESYFVLDGMCVHRLRQLQQRSTKKLKKIVVVGGKVMCVDSVRGNGVEETRSLLESTISNLPIMQQSVPKKWVQILETSRTQLLPHRLMRLDDALDVLRLSALGVTKEQALDALQFGDDLGHLRLHTGSAVSCLVTDVRWLIDLLRPLLHHEIVHSLEKACSGRDALNSCDEAVAGQNCKGLARRDKAAHSRLLKMAKELQELSILHEELLPYLQYWDDLQEKRAALEILEKSSLVTKYCIGGSAPEVWVVVCRITIKQPAQSQAAAIVAGIDLDQSVVNGPVLCCKTDYYMPPGLFSTLQAVQISRLRQSARRFSVHEANSKSMVLRVIQTDTSKQHNISAWIGQWQKQQQNDDSQELAPQQCCLYLQADTLPLLTTLCCDLEGIIRDMYPGFLCTYTVLFHHLNSVYEWCVDSYSRDRFRQGDGPRTTIRWKKARGTLGYMLCHGLNKQIRIDAEPVNGIHGKSTHENRMEWNILLSQALNPLTAPPSHYFFLSHSGRDTAVELVNLIENVSGQDVLVSTNDTADMSAISRAQAVIILLSPAYLASRLSLLELGMALEARLGRGVPLLAVIVNGQMHACITRACDNWDTLRDKWRVAEATLELVRRRIEDSTILVWREWEDGDGPPTLAKLEAARSMVTFALGSAGAGSAAVSPDPLRPLPRFELSDCNGVVQLAEKK